MLNRNREHREEYLKRKLLAEEELEKSRIEVGMLESMINKRAKIEQMPNSSARTKMLARIDEKMLDLV